MASVAFEALRIQGSRRSGWSRSWEGTFCVFWGVKWMDCPNVTYLELAMFQSSRERERERACTAHICWCTLQRLPTTCNKNCNSELDLLSPIRWLIYAAILFNLNVLYNFGRSWSYSTLKLPLLSSTANTPAARGENCRRGPIFQHMKVGAPALHSAFAGILETSFWPSIAWGRFSLLDPWLASLTLWKGNSSSRLHLHLYDLLLWHSKW